MLIREEAFSARITSLLSKGKDFRGMARRHGMSAAAKIARKNYKKQGLTWTGAQQEFYDEKYAFNEKVSGRD